MSSANLYGALNFNILLTSLIIIQKRSIIIFDPSGATLDTGNFFEHYFTIFQTNKLLVSIQVVEENVDGDTAESNFVGFCRSSSWGTRSESLQKSAKNATIDSFELISSALWISFQKCCMLLTTRHFLGKLSWFVCHLGCKMLIQGIKNAFFKKFAIIIQCWYPPIVSHGPSFLLFVFECKNGSFPNYRMFLCSLKLPWSTLRQSTRL